MTRTKPDKRTSLPIDFRDAEQARLQTDQMTIFEVYEVESGRVICRTESAPGAQGAAGASTHLGRTAAIRARLAVLAPLLPKGGAK